MIPESKQYYSSGRWSIFFGLLSPMEQRILYAIAIETRAGSENITVESIADKCLQNPNRILPLLRDLESAEIIVGFSSVFFPVTYFLNSHSLERYCWDLPVERVFDPAKVASELIDELNWLIQCRRRQIAALGIDVSMNSIVDRSTEFFSLARPKTS